MPSEIYAHRGASKFAPENTMAAFELAYQLGADGIETDIQLTKDSIPILIHDEKLNRTTNAFGFVKDMTLQQIKQLDAGSWFSKNFTGVTIVSLDEFLQWVEPKSLKLNLELKNNKIEYDHIEHIVYEMVHHYDLLERTTISTFSAKSVCTLTDFGNVEVAFLTSKGSKNLIYASKEMGVQAVHIKYRLLKPQLIKLAKQENIAVRVYTVNKGMHMIRCFKLGCDAIFTDDPGKASNYRRALTFF